MLVIYEDIGPPALAARVGLLVVVNGVILGGAFLITKVVLRRRAKRLGLLCPSCGHDPLGTGRLNYTADARVERVLARGRCERCGKDLFHDTARSGSGDSGRIIR
jgi:hypothetical protein